MLSFDHLNINSRDQLIKIIHQKQENKRGKEYSTIFIFIPHAIQLSFIREAIAIDTYHQ